MTEERRAAPHPHDVADGVASPLPSVRPPPDGSSRPPDETGESPAAANRDSSAGMRRRGRMALRIPDDEVSRPQSLVPEPSGPRVIPVEPSPTPAEALPALIPTRIISITEPLAPPPPPVVEDDSLTTPPPTALVVSEDIEEIAVAPAEWPLEKDDAATILIERALDDETTRPVLPQAPSTPNGVALELDAEDAEEVRFDDDALTPALPRVVPPEAPERMSDPGDVAEVSNEDVMAVEAVPSPRLIPDLPPMRLRLPSQPSAVPAPPKTPSKPPLVIVPPHVASVQPSPVDSVGPRRKARLWWEELFNDDYLRTMEKLTDRQVAREADFIEDSLGIERGGAVLDLACGTGRQAIELTRRGYKVVGFDLSPAMLSRAAEEAQSRSVKVDFVQGDMREMTFEEQFDGVYSWNTGFGYFDEEKNAHVVDRVRHALKSGGLFLLDVVNRDFIMRQSPSLVWFEGDGCVCMDEMNVDAITSRMKIKRTLMVDDGRSREIEYSMRVYSLHELGKILHEHGFKVCEVSGRVATPGIFFGDESPRTIILAEKK